MNLQLKQKHRLYSSSSSSSFSTIEQVKIMLICTSIDTEEEEDISVYRCSTRKRRRKTTTNIIEMMQYKPGSNIQHKKKDERKGIRNPRGDLTSFFLLPNLNFFFVLQKTREKKKS